MYKLLLQFTTAPACLEAQRCIMVARNKDMEKRNRDVGLRGCLDCRLAHFYRITQILMLQGLKLLLVL